MIRRHVSAFIAALGWLASLATTAACADEPNYASPKISVETVLTGLDHPCGVAVQPETVNVFVADSGAGQVVKYSPATPNAARPVISGFPLTTEGKLPAYRAGPHGLVFLNQNTLVVAAGPTKERPEVVCLYWLPPWGSESEGKPLEYHAAAQKLAPSADDEKVATNSSFLGMALSGASTAELFVAAHGSEKSGVFKARSASRRTLQALELLLAMPPAGEVIAPKGIAINQNGLLLVSHYNKSVPVVSSELRFYNAKARGDAKRGDQLMSVPTPLSEIVALAYSPASRMLYAADLASTKPAEAGVYRLDSATIDGRAGVKAVKIAALQRPSSLAFAPDNTLYVTVFGAAAASGGNESRKAGQLVKITGDL